MPIGKPRSHFFIPPPQSAPFKPIRTGGGGKTRLMTRNRATHYQLLKSKLEQAFQEVDEDRAFRTAAALGVADGIYLEFISAPGYDLVIKSL